MRWGDCCSGEDIDEDYDEDDDEEKDHRPLLILILILILIVIVIGCFFPAYVAPAPPSDKPARRACLRRCTDPPTTDSAAPAAQRQTAEPRAVVMV